LAYDHRIGAASLRPGLGFGGGCLPKDIRAFMARAAELGAAESVSFLREMDAINRRQRSRMVGLAEELGGGAFKPDSDDIRDSPALAVATAVHGLGAQVTAYDPVALDRARRAHPELR